MFLVLADDRPLIGGLETGFPYQDGDDGHHGPWTIMENFSGDALRGLFPQRYLTEDWADRFVYDRNTP